MTKNTIRELADLTFVDVYGRIHRSIIQLTALPETMTRPDGMQIGVTRQELGKVVGCSREIAGRVLKNALVRRLHHCGGKNDRCSSRARQQRYE